MTQDALAEAVGKSRSHVANTLRLLNLPSRSRGRSASGALSAGHARALLAHPDPAATALAVIARGLNVRQTEALTQTTAAPPIPGPATAKDPETAALERDLSERLGLKVKSASTARVARCAIHYRSLDQLDGFVTLLSQFPLRGRHLPDLAPSRATGATAARCASASTACAGRWSPPACRSACRPAPPRRRRPPPRSSAAGTRA